MTLPRSDIEIIDPESRPVMPATPSKVRINGVEVLVADEIVISPFSESEFVRCTMTFLCSSLYIGPER